MKFFPINPSNTKYKQLVSIPHAIYSNYRNSSNLTRPLINVNWQFGVKSCNLFSLIWHIKFSTNLTRTINFLHLHLRMGRKKEQRKSYVML